MIDFRVDDCHSLLNLDGFFLGVAYLMMGACFSAAVAATGEVACRVKPCNKKHGRGSIRGELGANGNGFPSCLCHR